MGGTRPFRVEHTDAATGARAGTLRLASREVETPAFMPVATKGAVKFASPRELEAMGCQVWISNAFVLYLRPGLEVIERAGGLHNFANWHNGIFTDSGGFQMLDPDFLLKVDDEGILFRSPFDGTRHKFTPEKCAGVQAALGSDVAMVLDHCPPYGAAKEEVAEAARRTTDWALRFRAAHHNPDQLVFAITQGGTFGDLRELSARGLAGGHGGEGEFDGYGIGGLCIGEPKELMHQVLERHLPMLPFGRPRYLMGVGSPEDMLEAIGSGTDMFDSVFPTRNARHNTVYTSRGRINMGKASLSGRTGPLDPDCDCFTCINHDFSFVNHLLREYEWYGMRLATLHNLHFLQNLVKKAREAIVEDRFSEYRREFLEKFRSSGKGK